MHVQKYSTEVKISSDSSEINVINIPENKKQKQKKKWLTCGSFLVTKSYNHTVG